MTVVSNEDKSMTENEDVEILDKIENLPPDRKENLIATLEMYSGPIPHPKILEDYQKLYPNAAKEIIQNGVEESKHRRELETRRQKRRGNQAWTIIVGVIGITILFIVLSFELIMHNHKIIGGIFAGTSFVVFMGSMLEMVPKLSSKDDISTDE